MAQTARAGKSPLVAKAQRLSVRFDRARKPHTQTPGRWVSSIKTANFVVHEEFRTEREARRFLGLPGGNTDPEYRPGVDNGHEVVVPQPRRRKK